MCLRRLLSSRSLCLAAALSATLSASPERLSAQSSPERFALSGELISQLHLRNDSDFDPTERLYDLDGQSDGQAVTLFRPTLHIEPGDGVRVHYQLELGWNAWSNSDTGRPNQYMGGGAPGLVARHQQAWAEWAGGALSLRVGFQPVQDPTGLFINQPMGALSLSYKLGGGRLNFVAGQLSDTSFEGLEVRNDNYMTDNLLTGLSYEAQLSERYQLGFGLYQLIDRRVIDRPFELTTAALSIRAASESLKFWLELAGQRGSWRRAALGGGDVELASYAGQAGVSQAIKTLELSLNLLALSPDNALDGDSYMGAFYGSAKNRSQSLFVTEDETRDRYDNLDERLGSYWGSLSFIPAGLSVVDASVAVRVNKRYRPRLTLAYAVTLRPERALGQRHVGAELSFVQELRLSARASLLLTGLLFAPGGAAAAMVNDVDREATELLYGGAFAFKASF